MNRRDWLKNTPAIASTAEATVAAAEPSANADLQCGNARISVRRLGSETIAWSLTELFHSRT